MGKFHRLTQNFLVLFQANMDPKHRDRVALCGFAPASLKDMTVNHARTGKLSACHGLKTICPRPNRLT